ncbi:suppressor of fused domain protein [Spirillospora sp. NPDC049024]
MDAPPPARRLFAARRRKIRPWLDSTMDLIREFSPEQYADALDAWEWTGLEGKVPLFASPFGDVFLGSDDGCWFLSVVDGTLTRCWNGIEALRAELDTPEGRDRYLMAGLASEAEHTGMVPDAKQIYDFRHPPVAGGSLTVDNLQVIDFVVGVNIAGQIHGQVKDLPEGAEISISTDLEEPGWAAIESALRDLYGGAGSVGTYAPHVPYSAGGPDPLDAIQIYAPDEPRPHWHLVSFGMSELYEKVTDDLEMSGFGIEFSLRVARGPQDEAPPKWSAVLLQQLARYVFAERPFAPGHTIHVARGTFGDRPDQDSGTPTELAALAFAVDPQLAVLDTPHGQVTFLQVAALTEAEYAAAKGGRATAVLERIERDVPLHIVDTARRSTR